MLSRGGLLCCHTCVRRCDVPRSRPSTLAAELAEEDVARERELHIERVTARDHARELEDFREILLFARGGEGAAERHGAADALAEIADAFVFAGDASDH